MGGFGVGSGCYGECMSEIWFECVVFFVLEFVILDVG